MVAYLRAVWGCRYFWMSLVKIDLRSRYRGSVLGIGWSLLYPIAMTAILSLVFCKVLGLSPRNYAPFLMAGLTCWQFIISSALTGSQCFFQAESYIRQHPAPMAIYPLRTMLANAFHFSLALLLVLILALIVRGFENPWPLLSLLPSLLLLCLLGWALSTIFGLITVRFRDTSHLSELGFQALFYLTPVMYPPSMLERRGLGFLVEYNPLVPFLNLLRQPILDSQLPSPANFIAASLVVLVLGTVAAGLLWREEKQLIFHL